MPNEPYDLHSSELRDRAVRAALGLEPFDVLITGGTLVDVATSEMRPADIGLVGPLIASVHALGTRRDAKQTIDASERFITPGFIDTHMHVESSMVTPRRYAETVVPQGTTTVCWDPHEIGNVAGLDGIRWALEETRQLPLRFLTLAPSCVPSAPGLELAGAEFRSGEMSTMLSWPEISGVAEVMNMRGVLERSEPMRSIVEAGLASGKRVCGHARGLEGAELQAFIAAGIQSDHELTSGEDLLAKLRAGLTVELRGSHDYVLPGVIEALKKLPHLPQTLTICTDDVFPDDLVNDGAMSSVLRRLIGYGMKPVDAVRAATLNAAMWLNRYDLGLVAPGRRADIVILSDLERIVVDRVYASGREVARDGNLIGSGKGVSSDAYRDTVKLGRLSAADFTITLPGMTEARVNTVVSPRFTKWGEAAVKVEDGKLVLPDNMLLMAAIHRHGRKDPTPVIGILEDWGHWRGALATTISHDSHNLTVFGRDPADMAAAANAVIEAGGGMATAAGGRVTAVLPLPVCGLLSDAPAKDVADDFAKLRAAADAIADWMPPIRTFKAVVGASLACNPGPHVTDLGLTDGTTRDIRPLLAKSRN
ncbi:MULTISPECIES: adenine deaminase C-terminal domain-containing protein [unclassified Rhizobium]|uniref:adenine deaminase n=1 Tax=unclassified Rhizobium TaxID=2613769 RepID=UPI0016125D2A|nr:MULTISPECIES: adenine deaminase C-terminal domain-containing protein [unclassified Rhizobium]MBB3383787.1 adenine deaminase [Rhizobium sp. BK098]MBB3615487.1 adenine deaminase [Rhizobium sp. BK609]MBB3681147.1 adenine deaminase [Rhizobium sp. BK612]